MTYEEFLVIYQRLFNILSKELGRYDKSIPFVESSDISILLANWSKYQKFHEKVIKQPTYSTDSSESLFESLYQSLTPVKTILDKLKNQSDPNKIDRNSLNLLLRTFGFEYLHFPTDTKKQLLLELVNCYKKKGTIESLEKVLNILSTRNISISEVYFEKEYGDPIFTYELQLDIPGGSYQIKMKSDPDKYIKNDPHWFITKDDLRNWEVSKAITPYIDIQSVVNIQSNLKAITILRTYAAKDYQIYQHCKSINDMSEYEKTKILSFDMLPYSMNFLELYEVIRYIYLLKTRLTDKVTKLEEDVPTYSYNPPDTEYDIIIDDLHKQYQTRYQTSNGPITSSTKITKYDVSITNLCLTKLPNQIEVQHYVLDNLSNACCAIVHNKVVVAGGIDKSTNTYNKKVYIFGIFSPNNVYTIDTDIECLNPVIVSNDINNEVHIGGGTTIEGSKNYRCWAVSTLNYTCNRITDIPKDMWMENPLVLSNNYTSYVISRNENDKCPGGIYEWNLRYNYKKLIAIINTDDYDITSLRGCITSSNHMYFQVLSKHTQGTRIIYLDPDPKEEIFADITCMLIKNMPNIVMKEELSHALYHGKIILSLCKDSPVLIIEKENGSIDYWIFTINKTYGPIRNKVVPRKFSTLLLPSRLCYLCPTHDIALCTKDSVIEFLSKRKWNELRTVMVDYDYWNDFLFIKIFDNFNDYLHPYWPLVQQIRSITCQTENATIETFLPNIELIYDSLLKHRFTYDNYEIDSNIDILNLKDSYWSIFGVIREENGTIKHEIFENETGSSEPFYDSLIQDKTRNRFRYDLESYQIVFPRFYFLDFDTYLGIMGFYKDIKPEAFRELHKLSQSPGNSHYCYYLYDDTEKYDIQCNLELVCYSKLPDFIEDLLPEYRREDFYRTYTTLKIPDYIIVNYLYKYYNIQKEYFDLPNTFTSYTLHGTVNKGILCYDDDNGFVIDLLLAYTYLDKLIPKEFTVEYTPDEKSSRSKRNKLLKERDEKLTTNEVLPNFENFEQLCSFLEEVVPGNKIEIDSSIDTNIDQIQYELLHIVSKLYSGSDLSNLIPSMYSLSDLYPIIDMFKPIYSRYLTPKIMTVHADPVGDWTALEDSFEIFFIHTQNSYLSMVDSLCFQSIVDVDDYVKIYEVLKDDLLKKLFDVYDEMKDLLTVENKKYMSSTISLEENHNSRSWKKLQDVITNKSLLRFDMKKYLFNTIPTMNDNYQVFLDEKIQEVIVLNDLFTIIFLKEIQDILQLRDSIRESLQKRLYDNTIYYKDRKQIHGKSELKDIITKFKEYYTMEARKINKDVYHQMTDKISIYRALYIYDLLQNYDRSVWEQIV